MARRALRWLLLSASVLACGHANAALSPDPTGLWYDPAESGWGLSVAQQGETSFAVLFVYDATNHPVWYVASDLHAPSSNPPAGPMVTGTLYRTMGPWFGGAFDPHAVTLTPVGTLTLQYSEPGHQSLQVGYTIDGISVAKSVRAQTWADGGALLPGSYVGGLRVAAKSAPNCDDLGFTPIDPARAFNFQVIADQPPQMHLIWGTGIDTICVAVGQYAQHGQHGSLTGVIGCGVFDVVSVTNTGPNAVPLQLTDLAITEHGFSGALSAQRGSCTYTGHVGGVRLP